ncbi:hypothetical protein Q2941_44110 [Bradyrhizobium sp. UFLA05-153]
MNRISGWCFSVCDKNHGSAALVRVDEAKAALMIEEAPALRRGTPQRQYPVKILLDDPEQSKFPTGRKASRRSTQAVRLAREPHSVAGGQAEVGWSPREVAF